MRASLARSKRSRARWVGSLIVVIVVTVPSVAYLSHRMGRSTLLSADRVPRLGPSAMTIAPGIHLLGGLDPAAAYVVETSEGSSWSIQDSRAMQASLSLNWRHSGSTGGVCGPYC